MFDEAISLISICSSMNSWLTPTVLFVLLNLMIGTIAFTSALSHKTPSQSPHEQQFQPHQQQQHHFQQHQQQQQHHFQQPQLITRSSSVLQRLKSINFNNLYTTFYSHNPSTHFHQPEPEPEPEPEPQPEPQQTTTEEYNGNGYVNGEGDDDDDDTPSMEEIYNRIKQSNPVSHYNRQNSDTKPSGGELPVKLPQKMKKSASHKSAFNHFHLQPSDDNNNNVGNNSKYVETVEEEEERENVAKNKEDEGVDAQADDFINRFKKKLQLERIHSIVRYKEMISRTSAQ